MFVILAVYRNFNTSLFEYSIPWKELNKYNEREFRKFVSEVIATPQYFNENAKAVQKEIFDFYLNNNEEKKNSTFYLKKYTQVCLF